MPCPLKSGTTLLKSKSIEKVRSAVTKGTFDEADMIADEEDGAVPQSCKSATHQKRSSLSISSTPKVARNEIGTLSFKEAIFVGVTEEIEWT